MRRCLFALLLCLASRAQTPRALYQAQCAGCHGPNGEGSRGPSLRNTTHDRDSLIDLLRRGVPGTEMTAIAPQLIADGPLRELAQYVLSLRAASSAPTRGAGGLDLFRGKGKCLDCHRLDGEGQASGPDLSDIGNRRDPRWIRQSILEPEAAIYDSFEHYRWTILIPDNYLLVEGVTAAGERVSGSRLNEDAFSIQLRDSAGRIRSFRKSELSSLTKRWGKSPMPSYKDVFTAAELDELVSWLSSLRGRR
jgi:putative heme-binding domain-containing protein